MQDLTFNVPESWGKATQSVERSVRKFYEDWDSRRKLTRKKRVRLRKRRNKTVRWLRWKLSQQRRGKNKVENVQMHWGNSKSYLIQAVNPTE
jgi:hypothetical protein